MNENEKDLTGNENCENQNQEPTPQAQPNVSYSQPNHDAGGNGGYNYSWNSNNAAVKKKGSGKKLAALMVACTLIISVLAFCAGAIAARYTDRREESSYSDNGDLPIASDPETSDEQNDLRPIISPSINDPEFTSDLKELYAKCSVSCATIYVKMRGGYSIGSGFVVSKEGYIVTNHHVVEDGSEISVIFYNGDTYTAEVVGSDSLSDIAVLHIDAEDLAPIELGDSSKLEIGDSVFAIGTPYNINLAGTMTTGVISGLNRKINVTNDYGTVTKTMTLIQTDSSINPGNSGGPLINMAGQVIGINSLKLSNFEGIGFAIPISNALKIVNELIQYGEVKDYDGDLVTATPKLNITVANVDDARTQYGIPENAPDGCVVLQLTRNSAIYKAGLELYDIIVEFNGEKIDDKDDLSEALGKCKAGQSVKMKVYRISRDGSGREYELTFKLEAAS